MSGLNTEEVAQYRRDGYVLKRGLISVDVLARLEQRFLDLVHHPELRSADMQVMRDVMVVKAAVQAESPLHEVNKLFSFEDDAELMSFTAEADLLACLADLLGPSIYCASTNVFNKPPGVDGRHPFHQDLRYYKVRPADKIVGVWTAMQPATRESGCLAVLPGSHKEGLLDHDSPDWEFVNHGFYGAQGIDLESRQHVEMAPGDTLFFHPLLLHGSGHNKSTHFRRAISAHFIAGDAQSTVDRDWRDNPLVRQVANG